MALREGKGRALVAVMAANNETGVIQPLAEAFRLVREADALLLQRALHPSRVAKVVRPFACVCLVCIS